ncbi:protein FAR1-RELATED SEQUENCE 5-like [Vicia villosa]|uniref:protein FAR1-RELATED SEQUENCE 5-like n=1 Tax=Vicia villosa TaxID=3911 RepID=UPI00273C6C98|nr:protein FAR1-RELATED SEQUENCE 5-like [Vicia villosa]
MAPRYIVSALKDKDPENITSITQIYRARATYKLGKRGALTEMKMLLSLIHQEKYMCWSRNKENSDIVADIFWTHLDSVKLLNMFPLVLIFDCTYRTNRYRLLLLEIVGVTSKKLTFSVAFAYLKHEREENFTWALEKLIELFYSKKLLPYVMVTDRELALMNAIDFVYPNASHLLCMFHISKKVSMKCKEYVKSERQEHVMDQWNNMMYSNTEDEFDVHLNHFESVCGDIPSFVKYVKETWLTPYKERFVAAWTNRVTHLGNTTTNSFVSRQYIQLVGKELEKFKFAGASKERCGCYIRTTHGLPCACQLGGYQILGIPIPLETIHVFWMKLQILEYEVSPDESKWDLEEECEELKRQFSTMDIMGQRALKKKVFDLAYPSTSSMCPSLVKYKSKRGINNSRKGEENDVHRDPS